MRKGMLVFAAAMTLGVATEVRAQAPTAGFTITGDYRGTRAFSISDVSGTARNESQGGGFNYRATSGANPWNLTDFVTYCFDATQYIQDPNVYRALTFQQFVDWTQRPTTYDQVDFQDLVNMASLANSYGTNAATNGQIQRDIWQISMNNPMDGTPIADVADTFSNSWGVLIDEDLYQASINNRAFTFTSASQPFLVRRAVPEPSTLVLLAVGLAGVVVVRRRKGDVV